MTGEELYKLWCDAPGSDRERYWPLMNPADKEAWEKLARRVVQVAPKPRHGE